MQLNTYDYAARYMDPAIGRFTSIDPLAEKYYSWSPYAYVYNNPLKFIDPNGKSPILPVLLLAYLALKPQPVNAPTGDPNDRRMQGAWKEYDQGLMMDLLPGPPGKGQAASSLGKQLLKEGGKQVEKQVGKEIKEQVEKTVGPSRSARREVMREQGIPTSQQPKSQSKNQSGREYQYDVPKDGGGTKTKSVQQQTKDRSHPENPHWEAGKVKTDKDGNIRNNNYGRPKLENDKSKVNYVNP